MKAIASRNEITLQLTLLMLVDKSYAWLTRRYIVQLDVLDVEQNGFPLLEACGNQVLQDFMLRVHCDGASALIVFYMDREQDERGESPEMQLGLDRNISVEVSTKRSWVRVEACSIVLLVFYAFFIHGCGQYLIS